MEDSCLLAGGVHFRQFCLCRFHVQVTYWSGVETSLKCVNIKQFLPLKSASHVLVSGHVNIDSGVEAILIFKVETLLLVIKFSQ